MRQRWRQPSHKLWGVRALLPINRRLQAAGGAPAGFKGRRQKADCKKQKAESRKQRSEVGSQSHFQKL